MEFLLASTLLVAAPTNLSQADSQPELPPVQIPVETPEQDETVQTPLNCAPGQFPSTFSDVFPTDWAYQAVIRLSSHPVECFDYPDEELDSQ